MKTKPSQVRIDKWLWAARFFKTRQLAIKALKNSQISRSKQDLKPASTIKQGDILKIERGIYELELEVLELSEQRGPAKVAQTLYRETSASIEQREQKKNIMAMQPKIDVERRKPDKHKLRQSRAFKRGDS